MIRAVIFDCFGVLTVDIWRAFCDGLPENVDRQALQDLNKAADSGLISFKQFADGIMELTGEVLPDVTQMPAESVVKNVLLLDHIKQLKRTYKIGLLSNISNDWITSEFLSTEEQALFDDMVMSYQVRMTKPDTAIFELACQRLGVRPKEAILIDDVERYITAAQSIGMHGIVYNDLAQYNRELERLLNSDL